ncbi:MAG TPA: DNA N-6-adenine-methyltransferase [Vampirovibrionales bacterium]
MQLTLNLEIDFDTEETADSPVGTDEWYTPRHIVDRVLAFFGGEIDLDPASNSHTNPNVPARRVFTAKDDGLSQPWAKHSLEHGWTPQKIWCNPPYSRNQEWAKKALFEWQAGHIEEILVLVPNKPGTQWFKNYIKMGPIMAIIEGRLKFGNATTGAKFESVLIYGGDRMEDFRHHFQSVASCFLIVN